MADTMVVILLSIEGVVTTDTSDDIICCIAISMGGMEGVARERIVPMKRISGIWREEPAISDTIPNTGERGEKLTLKSIFAQKRGLPEGSKTISI